MPKVTIIHNSNSHELEIQLGQTVLSAALKLNLDELGFGDCGGNCSCSTCHVYVEQGGESLKKPSIDEEDLLDNLPSYQPNSRLACQLQPLRDGLVVKVADA